MSATVTLEPWSSGDLPLLERLMGTAHDRAPRRPREPGQLRERQGRYERLARGDHMPRLSTWRAAPASARSASGRRSGATIRSTRSAGWSWRSSRAAASRWRRPRRRSSSPSAPTSTASCTPPERLRPAVERDLPHGRLRAARGVRVRVPQAALHDLQRPAPGPARLATTAAPLPTAAPAAVSTHRWRCVDDLNLVPGWPTPNSQTTR